MLNIPGILVGIWLVFTITCFVRWVALALENERLAKEEKKGKEGNNMKGKSEGFTRDSKNFLSARVSAEEMHAALGSPGECDHCGHRVDVGTLIGVLNSWLCDGCHGEWFKGAKWYAQDAPVEDSRVTSLASRFGWPRQRNEAQQQSTSQRRNEASNREADEVIKDFVNAILAAKSSER